MTQSLDTRRIRASTPAELRDYYEQLLEKASIEEVTTQLLQSVEKGSVPPLTFAPWLGVSKSPATIRVALSQNVSVLIRKFAIKQLRNALSSSRWKETWEGVGGVAGMLDIFADFSVLEVREACKAIGGCGKGNAMIAKREDFTELFKGLHPDYFPDARHKTKDRRPLARYYRLLMPACSEKLVNEAVASGLKGTWKQAMQTDLLRYHPDVVRKELLRSLASDQEPQPIPLSKPDFLTRYPSTTSARRGFSASMEFSLTVLRQSVKSERCVMEDDFFVDELVRPLLVRAIKKRADWDVIKEIVDLIMQYLEAHPSTGKEITTDKLDVFHLVAVCWSRKPQLFDEPLRKLLSHPVFGTFRMDELRNWTRFVSIGVVASRRYTLLRLCYHESTGFDIDVDADLAKAKGELSQELLDSIGPKQALLLFTRLRRARGDQELVEGGMGRSVLSLTSEYEGHNGDIEIYHIYLLSRNGKNEEAEVLATEYMSSRKKKATSASQPEQRAFYANSALYAAIASESLELYKHTLEWTKRFLRDPLVFREVYTQWFPEERKRLLSGVPDPITESLSLDNLRQRVETANSVLVSMFDTACEALREPSFAATDWQNIFGLFYDVVKQRIDLTPRLKKLLGSSDDELYSCLWTSTVPMLVEIEERANEEGNEGLKGNLLRGVTAYHYYGYPYLIELSINDHSTYTFLDKLGQARDHLWSKLRRFAHPAITTLPEPFPRGLPIQHLTAPWKLNVQKLEKICPFISQRVQATLFPNADVALRVAHLDDESQGAIGVFVDSYEHALDLYASKACDREQRQERVKKVWDYAIGPLSHGRMNEDEAIRFWSDKGPNTLKDWWPPKHVVTKLRTTWPLLPVTENPDEPSEWNPFTSGRPDFPTRELGGTTYLDLSVAAKWLKDANSTVKSKLGVDKPEVPAHEDEPDKVWSLSRDMGEGGVLSALLFLDAKYVTKDRLLATSFPSEQDARYPSLYLDVEFLDQNPLLAARNIRGQLDAIPPALLEQLAQTLIGALDSADSATSAYTTLHEVAILLVIRLTESDRPALATNLAIRTVLDRPKSSSWHRRLLKPSFLRRLSATEAKSCMETFAEEVVQTLQTKKNAEEQGTDRDVPEASAGQSHVKVTTIKHLAQLLGEKDLVGTDHALSVLSKLSATDLHVDVRLNIVKALLELLKLSSSQQSNDILDLLESIVSSAGALNEREPLTEADWAECEKDLMLPEHQSDSESPILDTLVAHFCSVQGDVSELQPFVDRIIFSTLERLKQQTARWVTLFLRKYGGEDAAELELYVPPVPQKTSVSQRMLSVDDSRLRCLPRTVLEEWVSYTTFNIAPPASIEEFNNRLREDHTLASQKDIETWLDLYGQGLDAVEALASFDIISLLGHASDSADGTGITHKLIQEQFLKLYTAVLWKDKPTYNKLTTYACGEFLRGTCLLKTWWIPYGKSIIEAMISYVDTLRTREWERDPDRSPSVLPDMFFWRLRLLDYPWPGRNDNDKDREKKCEAFSAQLSAIVNELSGTPIYHDKLSQLEAYLALDALSSTEDHSPGRGAGRSLRFEERDPMREALMHNRIITATHLGDITKTRLSWLTRHDLLKVEVAGILVESVCEEYVKDVDSDVREGLKGMVELWKRCENEGVRRKAWEIEEKYLGKVRDKWGF
jgi:hypothetical protein